MRRGHQYHPRFSGQRKSSVSMDEVVAALRNQELVERKTPPLSPASMDSQQSSPQFFRERLYPSSDERKRSKRFSGNYDGYQSGSSGNSSPSTKRYSRPRSFYGTPNLGIDDPQVRKERRSVNDRLNFHQRRSDEDLSVDSGAIYKTTDKPPEKIRNSNKHHKSKSEKQKLTPTNRATRSPQEPEKVAETPSKKSSKRRSVPEDKSKDEGSEDWSKMRCTSAFSEEVADKERKKNKNKDDLEHIFAEAVFRSDTLMRFNIIKNELHNIQKSQLRRAENDVSSFNKRIESQENELGTWEKDLTLTKSTLTETAASMEKAKKAKELAVEEIISYDECMNMLEEKLNEIRLEQN